LAVSGPSFRLSRPTLVGLVPRLRATAASITELLGAQPAKARRSAAS
ncbi:MAG: hypothetical protein QOH08_878, partial [Chloroflexota bacterium]|nr:hypothetical protein [Chloroflexota bacterium]